MQNLHSCQQHHLTGSVEWILLTARLLLAERGRWSWYTSCFHWTVFVDCKVVVDLDLHPSLVIKWMEAEWATVVYFMFYRQHTKTTFLNYRFFVIYSFQSDCWPPSLKYTHAWPSWCVNPRIRLVCVHVWPIHPEPSGSHWMWLK